MASESEDFVYFLGKGETLSQSAAARLQKPQKAPLASEILSSDNDDVGSGAAASSPEQSINDEPSAAVNEETGEINWDCPCLKSALEPPCGHTFKAAFACFVASKTEPKGLDCHELFQAMQECFQAHPEKYGAILADDEEDAEDADDELHEQLPPEQPQVPESSIERN